MGGDGTYVHAKLWDLCGLGKPENIQRLGVEHGMPQDCPPLLHLSSRQLLARFICFSLVVFRMYPEYARLACMGVIVSVQVVGSRREESARTFLESCFEYALIGQDAPAKTTSLWSVSALLKHYGNKVE